ncbi:MAG TPA: arylsulfatase [Bryobacteraceae bacterium]|nr:arylsulfatase [Bryobacteraceae bacterium]
MGFTRRQFLTVTTGAALAAQAPSSRRRPNILIVLADDQGWGDLSAHGNTNLRTPHIDSLARDGALFDRFYVCPVCAPTRAEFMTGRYHARGGVRGVSTGEERLNIGERTIAEVFREAGYATGIFGKWHNGSQPPYHPNFRGFQEFYGFTSGHWGQYFTPELDHNGKMIRGNGYIIDDLTDHAIGFIEQNRSRPFFCYLPFNSPHSPMQVPDEFYGKFQDAALGLRATDPMLEDIPHTKAALAMCENIDWNVGRVLAKLKEWQLERDTLVIYFSDNGPNGWRWNGGMKGRKGTVDEGGVRAPFLIRWPWRIPAGKKVTEIAGAIDILPTLTELAGIRWQAPKPLDGLSLRPLLTGAAGRWADRMIFSQQRNRFSVRTQQYRLDGDGKLYDMQADPGQMRDVSGERPEEAERLREAVRKFAEEVKPFVGPDDRAYPVGYAETTWLPARDGVGHGGIQRSAKAPNCSFFTHWTSAGDRITWDTEVLQTGEYMAELYYTCAAADVGSEVELRHNNAVAAGKISVAHDPPLEGKEHDRVDRGAESYVKRFRPLRLGVIRLEKGRGLMTLRATKVAGKQVADLRYLILTREKEG